MTVAIIEIATLRVCGNLVSPLVLGPGPIDFMFEYLDMHNPGGQNQAGSNHHIA